MSLEEIWTWIHYSNGENLGFSIEDQDYFALSPEEKAKHMSRIELEAATYQDLEGLGTSAHSKVWYIFNVVFEELDILLLGAVDLLDN